MAQVLAILTDLYASGQVLEAFAQQTRKWKILSSWLVDLREGLEAADLSLEAWQKKYDVQPKRHPVYLQVLFGHAGCERIQSTLDGIDALSKAILADVNQIVNQALKARLRSEASVRYSNELVETCLQRILKRPSWSQKFTYYVLNKTDSLEIHIEQLHTKLTLLERLSDLYIESEHPSIFHSIQRLPGRRVIFKPNDVRYDAIQQKLLEGLSARKDAELLHSASGREFNTVHIGLSVPQIHKRDFAFLISLEDRTHQVLMHPVRIKTVNDPSRVQSEMSTSVNALINNTHDACYMLPLSTSTAGFQVTVPPSNVLSDMEFKFPLTTLIRERDDTLGLAQQILYPEDTCALACGIAKGSFRFIGSQWLDFLDCRNVRCRRGKAGAWTTMLTAIPGDAATTHTLEQLQVQQSRDRDITRHIQIFRIGILLASLALKASITSFRFEPTLHIYINDVESPDQPLDAQDIAALVESRTNIFVANMVAFCLSALHYKNPEAETGIEGAYYKEVLGQADELMRVAKGESLPGSRASSIAGSQAGSVGGSREPSRRRSRSGTEGSRPGSTYSVGAPRDRERRYRDRGYAH